MRYWFPFVLIFGLQCVAYDDYYPASGTFCELQTGAGECVDLLIEEKKFIFEKQTYPLLSFNRASYQTIIGNQTYSIKMFAEHRIELEYPDGRKQLFHRKKKKR